MLKAKPKVIKPRKAQPRAKSALAKAQANDLQAAARALGLQLHVLQASTDSDFDAVFANLNQLKAGGLVISSDSFFFIRSERLALAMHHGVPAIFGFAEFPKAGGLMSYGASVTAQDRMIGAYVGRILKGEKPADLPVVQASKFEFVINLRTAKTLGLTISHSLISAADEVID